MGKVNKVGHSLILVYYLYNAACLENYWDYQGYTHNVISQTFFFTTMSILVTVTTQCETEFKSKHDKSLFFTKK